MAADGDMQAAILAISLADPSVENGGGDVLPADEVSVAATFMRNCVASHDGQEVEQTASTYIAVFTDALNAVRCSRALKNGLHTLESGLPADAKNPRIAASLVSSSSGDSGVSDAIDEAKALWDVAAPGAILLGKPLYSVVNKRIDASFEPIAVDNTGIGDHVYKLTDLPHGESDGGFFEELVRRRIFRAAGAYIVVAWVLVQVASILFPEFGAPRWAMRALIVMLIAGFPPALLLAWTVDFSAGRFVRTPESSYSMVKGNALRVGMVVAASVAAFGMMWWVWTGYVEPSTMRPGRTPLMEHPVVAVIPPRKTAGPAELDWLGEGVAHLIRNQIAESSAVIVVSPARWNAIAGDATAPDELVSAAYDAGIDYLIGGRFLQTLEGISLSPEIEDVAAGISISAPTIVGTDPSEIIEATADVSAAIKRSLNIPFLSNVEQLTADFAARNMEAYEAYVAGLGFFINFDFRQAEELFQAALAIAPDYHMARYRLASVFESTGRAESAYTELSKIPDDAVLTARERLYLEGAKATFTVGRDTAKSIETYKRLLDEYPYDMEAGQHLAEAYWNDFQDEAAIDVFRKMAEMHSYDPAAWMALGERLLEAGMLEDAGEAIGRYDALAPGDPYAAALLGKLEQQRGNISRSIEHFRQSLELRPQFELATLGLARSHYLNNEPVIAEGLWQGLADNLNAPPTDRIDAAFDLAGVFQGQGRFESASQILRSVEALVREEQLRYPMMLSTLGANQRALGNHDRALELSISAVQESRQSLATPTRYLFALGLLQLDSPDDFNNTIAELQALSPDTDAADQTEARAAMYLQGLGELHEGEYLAAVDTLDVVSRLDGYRYALYDSGLARAHFAAGNLEVATTLAQQALATRDNADLRLDLELDRARARLLLAEIFAAAGRNTDASDELHRFLNHWRNASDQAPEVEKARALLAELQ